MEHTFTFNSVDEMNLVNDILTFFSENDTRYLRPLDGMVNFNTYPHKENCPVSIENIIDRLSGAIVSALDEEKPKYEHRYIIRNRDDEVFHEDDDLENAFGVYAEYYQNDYASNHDVNEGDYEIYDNKVEEVVTSDIPYFDVEYEWSVDLDVSLDGRRVYDYEIPDWVIESIGNDVGGGDTAGSACDTIGNIEWSDIADWESDHEEEQDDETAEANADAVSDSTEESATEPDNTWHVY